MKEVIVMKLLKKLCIVTLCVLFIVGAVAGCSGQSDSSTPTGSTTPAGKTVKVGIIQYATHPSLDNCYEGLVKGLKEAGFVDGQNMELKTVNAQGSGETADQLAGNLVASEYDLIIGIATPAAISAYSAARNTEIPTVFCAVSDPVAAQLVQSLESTGTNCTGSSDLLNLEAQLKLIRALQPDAKKIGVLYTNSEANSVSHLKKLNELAPTYGFEIVSSGVSSAADIPQMAADLVTKVDCINNFTDNNVVDNLQVLLQKANDAGIPVYGSEIEQVKGGCLASETLDYVALGEKTGAIAARILNGESASSLPVVLVEDSYPVINTDVAAKLNITIPEAYSSAEKVTTQES